MKGRFAPSPTGRMHLGNIFTALVSWLSVRKQGGKWVLRHEDLDRQRSRPEYAGLIEEDLHWLGLDWDEGGLANPEYQQSNRDDIYRDTLKKLCDLGMVYPCYCKRAEIMATQAPHQSDGRIVYSGKCRPKFLPDPEFTFERLTSDKPYRWRSLRLAVPDRDISYRDLVCGDQSYNLARDCGDFVVMRADGAWAYQLAVVADDAQMGITEVVRGNDLLLSTSQQLYLYELLGMKSPRFAHTPLLVNKNGQRLSKRDQSLSMEILRQTYTPEELIGKLAYITGLSPDPLPRKARDLIHGFSFDLLTEKNIIIPDNQF